MRQRKTVEGKKYIIEIFRYKVGFKLDPNPFLPTSDPGSGQKEPDPLTNNSVELTPD